MEEAIKRLKQGMNSMAGEFVECWFRKEHLQLAIDAMEKQIPKKVTNQEGYYFPPCPSCGRKSAFVGKNNYCEVCGQRLDWGNENES